MATTPPNLTYDANHQARERLGRALRQQAEQIRKLGDDLTLLKNEQQQLEDAAFHLLEPLEQAAASGGQSKSPPASNILSSIRKLISAAYAGQVLEALAEEASRIGVRAAVFEVRGRAAWVSSAKGFSPELSGEALRTLAVSLNRAGPFRHAFETGEAVRTSVESLETNLNVLAMLDPARSSGLFLLPVRSAGSVAAIVYADTGERRDPALIDSLKVLVEFAGAQIDRLLAMSGGLSSVKSALQEVETGMALAPEAAALDSQAEAAEPEVAPRPETAEVSAIESSSAEPPAPPSEESAPLAATEAAGQADDRQAPTVPIEIARLSEEDQKVHRDALRFSRLLVSEIELYNRNAVEEGRRNKDLYQRLKKDIDRSRATYEKRFAHTVAKQVDYFYEDLVRTLAENDPALLGSGYPGPSV